jgi:hypothetical protein
MLRRFLSPSLSLALAATALLGPCAECKPRPAPEHSCHQQPAPQKQCPDRNEILRNYPLTERVVVVPVLPVVPLALPAPPVAIERRGWPTESLTPLADGPPDLFLRNAAILV